MRAAFVIFEGMTALDFVGAFDPISRLRSNGILPDLEWSICARSERVDDANRLGFHADSVAESLAGYDLVVVPGGMATRSLIRDAAFVAWIGSASESPLLASVCTGSLLLGAAGLLKGRVATTNRSAFDILERYVSRPAHARVVDAGEVVTAAGVSAAIDLGLYLCERLAGAAARERIAEQMEYRHYDPAALLKTTEEA